MDITAGEYVTDDRDDEERHKLHISLGGNGDYYVGVIPEGDNWPWHSVRICTSGGAATHAQGLLRGIATAYRCLTSSEQPKGMAQAPDAEHIVRALPHSDLDGLVEAMQYKFRKNRRKPCRVMNPDGLSVRQHEHMALADLIDRAKGEIHELEEALASGDMDNAMLEAADVANFMAFIFGKIRRDRDGKGPDYERLPDDE